MPDADLTMTLTATTGTKTKPRGGGGGGTTRHYRLSDGRGAAIQRTFRRGVHGLIVKVEAEHEGGWRTESYTRYFKMENLPEGWMLREEGWDKNVGGADNDQWLKLESGPFRTMKDAHEHALDAALDNVKISEVQR